MSGWRNGGCDQRETADAQSADGRPYPCGQAAFVKDHFEECVGPRHHNRHEGADERHDKNKSLVRGCQGAGKAYLRQFLR